MGHRVDPIVSQQAESSNGLVLVLPLFHQRALQVADTQPQRHQSRLANDRQVLLQSQRQASEYVAEGRSIVVDLDLEKFFDRVQPRRVDGADARGESKTSGCWR